MSNLVVPAKPSTQTYDDLEGSFEAKTAYNSGTFQVPQPKLMRRWECFRVCELQRLADCCQFVQTAKATWTKHSMTG